MFLSFLFPIPFLLFTLANFSSNLILPFFLSNLICKSNFLVSIFLQMWSSLQIIFVKRNIHPFSKSTRIFWFSFCVFHLEHFVFSFRSHRFIFKLETLCFWVLLFCSFVSIHLSSIKLWKSRILNYVQT